MERQFRHNPWLIDMTVKGSAFYGAFARVLAKEVFKSGIM